MPPTRALQYRPTHSTKKHASKVTYHISIWQIRNDVFERNIHENTQIKERHKQPETLLHRPYFIRSN